VLPKQKTQHTEWFHADCLADYYRVDVWSEEHWRIVENFIATVNTSTDVTADWQRFVREQQETDLQALIAEEKTGYENSSTLLMENAYYILTPTEKTSDNALKEYLSLIEKLGSIPIVLDPYEHDKITAAISHVPHIIAAQLVNLIQHAGPLEPKMKLLAAGGFKDITRIASSSPEIWESICLSNKESISNALTAYQDSLEQAKQMILAEEKENLYHMFDIAGTYRDAIPAKAKGVLITAYELFADIKDETGAIATLATMLSVHGLSIKNIGIVHNREFEQGVLHIEFYDEQSKQKARKVLESHGYHIYIRN